MDKARESQTGKWPWLPNEPAASGLRLAIASSQCVTVIQKFFKIWRGEAVDRQPLRARVPEGPKTIQSMIVKALRDLSPQNNCPTIV